jgi:phosphate starvation-inducible PhoH-like protein
MHNPENLIIKLDKNDQYRIFAPDALPDDMGELLRIEVKAGDYIFPRNYEQALLVAYLDRGLALNIATGDPGTGKTFLTFAHALSTELQNRKRNGKGAHGEKRKFFLVKPLLEVGEKLGALPGDVPEKISPSFQPFFDVLRYFFGNKLSSIEIKAEMGRYIFVIEGIEFEICPLAFILGRNVRNSYMFLDEAQNGTTAQVEAFCTRSAENTQVYVTGDVRQCYLPKGVTPGLNDLIEIMKYAPEATGKEDGSCHVELIKSDRSPSVQRFLEARRARDKAQKDKA